MSRILQRDRILRAEESLRLGPVALAKELNTPWTTFKDWKSGRRKMPGVAWKCLQLLDDMARQTRNIEHNRSAVIRPAHR